MGVSKVTGGADSAPLFPCVELRSDVIAPNLRCATNNFPRGAPWLPENNLRSRKKAINN